MNQSIPIQVSPDELDRRLEAICERVIVKYIQALDDEPMTPQQVAKMLGKSVSTVKRMRQSGVISPLTNTGRPTYSKKAIMGVKKYKKIL